MGEPWDSVTYHRGMVGQLEHDCAIRHTHRFPQWLLHLRQPDAIERAEPEPLVQHIFEHLGIAPAVEAAFRFPLKFSDSILLALVTTRESANRYGFICSSATMKLLARSARTVGRQIRFGSKLFLKEHFDESIPVLPTFPAARGASYQ